MIRSFTSNAYGLTQSMFPAILNVMTMVMTKVRVKVMVNVMAMVMTMVRVKVMVNVMVIVIVGFTSCTQEEIPDDALKPVTFSLQTQYLSPMGRASDVDIKDPRYLIVLDYKDGQLKATYTRGTKELTDIDEAGILDDLTLPLAKGEHTLYFLTSYAQWDEVNTQSHTIAWGSNSLAQTWAASVTLNVTDDNDDTQPVTLPISVGVVNFPFDGAIPDEAKSSTFTLSKASWTYNYFTGKGGVGEPITKTGNLASSQGKTGVSLTFYSFIPSDASNVTISGVTAKSIGTATISVVDYSGNELSKTGSPLTIQNVGILTGYQTNLTGNFWATPTTTSTLTIQDSWTGQLDISY